MYPFVYLRHNYYMYISPIYSAVVWRIIKNNWSIILFLFTTLFSIIYNHMTFVFIKICHVGVLRTLTQSIFSVIPRSCFCDKLWVKASVASNLNGKPQRFKTTWTNPSLGTPFRIVKIYFNFYFYFSRPSQISHVSCVEIRLNISLNIPRLLYCGCLQIDLAFGTVITSVHYYVCKCLSAHYWYN